jgi:hypothetical protein
LQRRAYKIIWDASYEKYTLATKAIVNNLQNKDTTYVIKILQQESMDLQQKLFLSKEYQRLVNRSMLLPVDLVCLEAKTEVVKDVVKHLKHTQSSTLTM